MPLKVSQAPESQMVPQKSQKKSVEAGWLYFSEVCSGEYKCSRLRLGMNASELLCSSRYEFFQSDWRSEMVGSGIGAETELW